MAISFRKRDLEGVTFTIESLSVLNDKWQLCLIRDEELIADRIMTTEELAELIVS